MAVSGTGSGARVNVTARDNASCAPSSLEVSFKTGNPNIALAPAAMIEWAAPSGMSQRRASSSGRPRGVWGEVNMISCATEPATVALAENPTSRHPITNGRGDHHPDDRASATISAPYWVHWLVPAATPSRVGV